jgi:hypothetical protein
VLAPVDQPVAKGKLCAQEHGFNLHGATRVAANDKQDRLTLCKYILRPPLANDRLKILDDEDVRLEFKKTWSKRHTVRYFCVLSSHATSRSEVVPAPAQPTPVTITAGQDKPKNTSKYISWSELSRRTFGFEIVCQKCKAPLMLKYRPQKPSSK